MAQDILPEKLPLPPHPDLPPATSLEMKASRAGAKAFKAGAPCNANAYTDSPSLSHWWRRGWVIEQHASRAWKNTFKAAQA